VILASRLRVLALFAGAGAAALASCSNTTTTTAYTPITGILIDSQALVAGLGCGMGDNQVFRYAAAVSFASAQDGGEDGGQSGSEGEEAGALVEQNDVPLTNIFDCFVDGVFENLPTSDAGSLTFTVAIYAYNQKQYDAVGLPASLGCPPTPDGGLCTSGTVPLTTDQKKMAPWTTTCTATQQSGTPVIAVCGPLVSPATGSESGDGSTDAGLDGASDAASDAGAAVDAAGDAGGAPLLDGSLDGAEPPTDGGDASTSTDGAPSDGAVIPSDG
jgi:hypothetical protein